MIDSERTLITDAITFLEREREILFDSFCVRLPGHPGFGQVVDEPERSHLEELDGWLTRARKAVREGSA